MTAWSHIVPVALWVVTLVIALSIRSLRDRRLAEWGTSREPLTPEEFANRFFQEVQTQNAAVVVRRFLELRLGRELSRLRPEDQLAQDLGTFYWPYVDFAVDLSAAAGADVPRRDVAGCRTVADLVKLVAQNQTLSGRAPN